MRDHDGVRTSQRRSDASANIDRIVAAARKVFARDGASATLSQVAGAAGVSDATLYRHFPNRQALAAAVYEDVFKEEVKPAVLALSGAPPEAYIDALVHLEDVMSAQRPLLASLDDLASLTAELIKREPELLEDIIIQAQVSGNLRSDLRPEEVATFVAMVTTASVAMDQPKAQRRLYVRLMVDGLRPTAAPTSPRKSTGRAPRPVRKVAR